MPVHTDRAAAIAKALGHPARMRIVELLAAQSECRGADVFGELPLAQSTVSEHLRVLKEAGIVSATSAGTATVYCLDRAVLTDYATHIAEMALLSPICQPKEACS